MRVFPTRLFYFESHETDIERRTLSGGTSIAGEEDVVEVDGGGRVYAVFGQPYLDEPEIALAWRALSSGLGNSVPIIVPLGDARHQMFGEVATPPGGLPWWNESDFAYSGDDVEVSSAALGATAITVTTNRLNGPIRAGVWFSINHPHWGHRAYRVVDAGDGATLSFRPPLREAVPSGTAVEFRDPKCVMRVDGAMTSAATLGFAASDQVRFIEFPGAIA